MMTGQEGESDFYGLACRSWSAPFQGKASRILRRDEQRIIRDTAKSDSSR